jgi:cytidine deaminase
MLKEQYSFDFEVFNSVHDLATADADLLKQAQIIAETAYAPYSNFFVGAVA